MKLVERNGKEGNPENGRRMFEPAGVFLAAIVGTVGLISLVKGAIPLAALCLPLAALGLVCSHKHFDRE
jgi:hypothetical protein